LKSYCESKGLNGIGVIETTVNDNINEIIAKIYSANPSVVAFSCYIWNIDYVSKIGREIKKLLPQAVIILGGPEVSFEEDLSNYPFAACIICGAGERSFYELLSSFKKNRLCECSGVTALASAIQSKIISGCNEDFCNSTSPYTDDYFNSFKHNQIPFVENQLIYYESSRGCPFSCSYCLSSAKPHSALRVPLSEREKKGVHYLPLDRVKQELLLLVEKGAKCIKFVDRTFNADKKRAKEILGFVRSLDTDCTFHFEAAADLFDDEMLQIVSKMPVKRIQFEIGLQSINEKTLLAIDRKTDTEKVLKNVNRLTSFQNTHIRVDLIAGLPHETLETFANAIDKCIECKPHMLQLGFLKMLKGAKIREENNYGEVFADFAPYEVFQTNTLSFSDIVKLKRIESVIEKFYNRGAFACSTELGFKIFKSPYKFFEALSDHCIEDGSFGFKSSMKNAYSMLLNFLLSYGGRREIEHNIKLDSLSFDGKSVPDEIPQQRNKQAELIYGKKLPKGTKFRIEFFEFDNTHKLFVYENKNLIAGRYDGVNISIEKLGLTK